MVVDMLRAAGVDLLVDVRSFPRSRTNPAFNSDAFADVLARVQIGYRHCPALPSSALASATAPDANNSRIRELLIGAPLWFRRGAL